MSLMTRMKLLPVVLLICMSSSLVGMFPNLTRNDPLPLYSTKFPFAYLSTRQKAGWMRFDYSYTQPRFRVSASGYRQYANRARNDERNVIYLGDINGPWNMLAFFYDPKLREVLYKALDIDTSTLSEECKNLIEKAQYSDPNQEFGFFSVPLLYRKYGARFESELILIDDCFDAVGLMIQWGINDIRQTVIQDGFCDLTWQALGKAGPAKMGPRGETAGCTDPAPADNIPGVTPPFVSPYAIPPCMNTACNVDGRKDCVKECQYFMPCCDSKLCLSYDAACKKFVIEQIMSQKDKIAKIIGLDICNYHKVGLDDLRLSMYWRKLYLINEDDERYPRLVFMPFAQLGVGIPMMKGVTNSEVFALPNGNNHHTYVSGRTGFTLDFLDTIDIYFSGGFSYFFKREYCNYYMPTAPQESGIFPYSADVSIRPGPTWTFNFGMHAWHFLDNLSVWIDYNIVSHATDKIEVCRSFIPEGSIYYEQGFDVDRAECLTKWESHVVNVGFNYDLFDCLAIGILWQAPARQRNAYRSGTILGSLHFTY